MQLPWIRVLLVCLPVLAACGETAQTPSRQDDRVPTLTRLTAPENPQPAATAEEPSLPLGHLKRRRPLCFEGFEGEPAWVVHSESEVGSSVSVMDDGNTVLLLSHPGDLAVAQYPIEPGEAYALTVRVQRSENGGQALAVLLPGRIDPGDLAQITALIKQAQDGDLLQRWTEAGDWTLVGKRVKSDFLDRVLVIVMSGPGPGDESPVRFDDISLYRALPAEQIAVSSEGSSRRHRLELGGNDNRWYLSLEPGDEMNLEEAIPEQAPHLLLGLAYATGLGERPASVELDLAIDAAGKSERHTWTLRPFLSLGRATWTDVDVALNRWAGQRVRFTFTVRLPEGCADPDGRLFIGAPRLIGSPRDRRPNVILVSLDTLRADHLGAYGYSRPTSPTIDALGDEGTVIETAYSTSSYTLPAHGSMLTGQYPATHGLTEGTRAAMSGQVSPRLAEVLADQGYVTLAATAGGYVDSIFGFASGFDIFTSTDPFTVQESPDPDSPVLTTLLERLDRLDDAPFFLFLHTYGAHDYKPSPEDLAMFRSAALPERLAASGSTRPHVRFDLDTASPEEAVALVDIYDGAIHGVDRALDRLVRFLRSKNLLDRTVLLITSDHGEEFLEHGRLFHAKTLYEEVVRIPMIWRGPGIAARRRLPGPMSLVDVAPTLLGLLGIVPDRRTQGLDLSTYVTGTGASGERDLAFEFERNRKQIYALRQGPFKLILNMVEEPDGLRSEPTLYDIHADPPEKHDIAAARTDRTASMTKLLLRWRDRMTARRQRLLAGQRAPELRMNDRLRKRLDQLGYADH